MPWWRRVCPPECQRYVTLWSRSLWLWYHLTIERSLLFFDVSIMCLLLKRKFVDYSSSESEMKTEILAVRVVSFNPLIPTLKLQSNGHYTAMRWLVHWPLMGWLLHLVQWGRAWAGCGPIQSPPRYTKCNSPRINGQFTNFILFDVALSLLLDSKGLTCTEFAAFHSYKIILLLVFKPPLATARVASCDGPVHLFICLSVCLSPNCKNVIFSKTKQFRAIVSIDNL